MLITAIDAEEQEQKNVKKSKLNDTTKDLHLYCIIPIGKGWSTLMSKLAYSSYKSS